MSRRLDLAKLLRSHRLLSQRGRLKFRRTAVERLEPRQVLTAPTLASLPSVTLSAGAPLNIALDGFDADNDALTYTVSSTNSSLAAAIAQGNPGLKISVSSASNGIQGDMVFQLFKDLAPKTVARISQLADSGFYDNKIFHRVISNFMIQGGDPLGTGSGGSGVQFDDEFNAALQFTSSGVLAMAKSADDTNDSQFFITSLPTRWLDFNHSIFGFLVEGDDIREKVESVATNSSDRPLNDVVMTQVRTFTDTQNRVLRLSAPEGMTGTADVTVTVSDGVSSVSRTFNVAIRADTSNSQPFLGTIAPIVTTVNTPVTVPIPATDVEGSAIAYSASITPTNSHLTATVNGSNGTITVTPTGGIVGAYELVVSAMAPGTSASQGDSQSVPVYIKPNAPTSVQLLPGSDTGASNSDRITNLDNSDGKPLQFRVTGLVAGTTIEVFSDYALIGAATASADGTLDITTNGASTMGAGLRQITVRQSLKNVAVDVGNLTTTVDLISDMSAPLAITIDHSADDANAVPVANAQNVATPENAAIAIQLGGDDGDPEVTQTLQYNITTAPAHGRLTGFDPNTGALIYTPDAGYSGIDRFSFTVTDNAAGGGTPHTSQPAQVTVAVNFVNAQPTANSQSVSLAEDVPLTIALAGDDGDPEVSQSLTFAIVQQPQHGRLASFNAATGVAVYEPDANYSGSDSFSFTVTDDSNAGTAALTSAAATVSLTITPVNDRPTLAPQTVNLNIGQPGRIAMIGSNGDPDFAQHSLYAVAQSPAHGTISSFDPATGEFIYTPNPGFSGQDTLKITLADDGTAGGAALISEPATVIVNVSVVNLAPTATNQEIAATEDTAAKAILHGDDGNPEVAQALTFEIVRSPQHGRIVQFNPATGDATYMPDANFSGTDSFEFVAVDHETNGTPASLRSQPARVTIVVAPVNDPPQAGTGSPAAAIPGLVWQWDYSAVDPEGEPLAYSLEGAPQGMTIDPDTGKVRWDVPSTFTDSRVRFTILATEVHGEPETRLSVSRQVDMGVVMPILALDLPKTGSQSQSLSSTSASSAAEGTPAGVAKPANQATEIQVELFTPQSNPTPPAVVSLAAPSTALGPLGQLQVDQIFQTQFGAETGYGNNGAPAPETPKQPKAKSGEGKGETSNASAPQPTSERTQDQRSQDENRDVTVAPPADAPPVDAVAVEAVAAAASDMVLDAILAEDNAVALSDEEILALAEATTP